MENKTFCRLGVFHRGNLVKSNIIFDYNLLMDQLYNPNIHWIDNIGYLWGKPIYEIEEVSEVKSNRGRPKGTGLVDSLIKVIKRSGQLNKVKQMSNQEIADKYRVSFPTAVRIKKKIATL